MHFCGSVQVHATIGTRLSFRMPNVPERQPLGFSIVRTSVIGPGFSVGVGVWSAFFATAQIELTYNWAHTRTEVEGTDSGIPFRRSRADRMEWFSLYVGFGLGF